LPHFKYQNHPDLIKWSD